VKSLADFSRDLRALPRVVAIKVAAAAAPVITDLAKKTFNASQEPDGKPWKPGAEGQLVTLRKTGDLAKYVTYVAIGTRLRVALGVKYAKYQIGKRPVYPRQEQGLPESYVRALMRVAVEVVRAELR
jgi:phage gpG-like protein